MSGMDDMHVISASGAEVDDVLTEGEIEEKESRIMKSSDSEIGPWPPSLQAGPSLPPIRDVSACVVDESEQLPAGGESPYLQESLKPFRR